MSVGMPRATSLHGHEDDVAVAHAALGDDAVRKCLDFGAAALEHRHFQATVVVEVHVECRLCQFVVLVEILGQPFRQLP